ncbi:MAG: crotonase/enoyl-CoA hydratase family protein [Pseudomonadota bacterium]
MTVHVEKQGKVTTVIIDRPQARNAVDGPTADALIKAFNAFEADDESAVAVLCGANDTFCAGADLKAVSQSSPDAIPLRFAPDGEGPMGPSRMLLSKPVIAAVSGYAVAGGLELALWCDLRVAEESSVFGVFCRRWGVPLVDGGTIRLPRLIGLSRAMDMILTGRPVEAQEALTMGLANRVVEDGQARQEAEKLAAEIAEFPQLCMRADRLSAHEQFSMDLPAALLNEYHRGKGVIDSGETLAGAARFAKGAGRHGSFEK